MTATLMQQQFQHLQRAARNQPAVPANLRLQHLQALEDMIRTNRLAFGAAIAMDFGQRPQAETDLAEFFPTLQEIRHARRHLARWMRRQPVKVGRWFLPARAWIQPQPLGVVGIMAPWNYPLLLSSAPLVSALAAGNRAFIKPSEHAPEFARIFARAVAEHFDPALVTCVQGGADIAAQFSQLPFDHLLFTGSTAVGRRVMQAASANLTPVTLELGGKSPALIAPDARLSHAVARIMTGKMLNAGQTCIAPDYVLLPQAQIAPFIKSAEKWVRRHYPDLARNPDYSRIINHAHYDRLAGALTDAQKQGAVLHPLSDAQADPATRLMPPIAVTQTAGALQTDEIFGPILPLIPYESMSLAINHITTAPRPLAFYIFTESSRIRDLALASVHAGGVCVNDCLLQGALPTLPFGGVGASGMGAYHGEAGFRRFSHFQPVFAQSRLAAAGLIAPPYRLRFRRLMQMMLR